MRLVKYPEALPYKCFSCGSARTDDRTYMDTEIDVEFYGVIYICSFCFETWFQQWQSPTITAMQNTINALASKVTELENERDGLMAAIRVIESPTRVNPGQFTLDGTDPLSEQSGAGSNSGKAGSVSSKQGRNDVRSPAIELAGLE